MGGEIQTKDSPRPGGRGQSRRPWGLVEIKAAVTRGREAAESEGGVDGPHCKQSPAAVSQSLSHIQLFVTPWTLPLCPRDPPGTNTRVGCHFLLQGILNWQVASLPLSHPRSLESPV